MSEPYIPTTEKVRRAYAFHATNGSYALPAAQEEFDRWLAAHDARVRREALKEAAVEIHKHRFTSAKRPILSRKLNAGVVDAEIEVRKMARREP